MGEKDGHRVTRAKREALHHFGVGRPCHHVLIHEPPRVRRYYPPLDLRQRLSQPGHKIRQGALWTRRPSFWKPTSNSAGKTQRWRRSHSPSCGPLALTPLPSLLSGRPTGAIRNISPLSAPTRPASSATHSPSGLLKAPKAGWKTR